MSLRYSFEKISGEERWQVRLNGEFVTYVNKKDPELVDNILRQNGYESREDFLDDRPILRRDIQNGNLKITNVPHIVENPYGSLIIAGNVMYRMARIFQYMLANKLTEIDYDTESVTNEEETK